MQHRTFMYLKLIMWTKVNSLFYSLNSFTVISHETLAAKSLLNEYLRLPWSRLLTFTLLVHRVLPSNLTAWDVVLLEQFFLHLLWNILKYSKFYCKTVYIYGITQDTVPYHSVLCLLYFTVKHNVVEIQLVKDVDRLI